MPHFPGEHEKLPQSPVDGFWLRPNPGELPGFTAPTAKQEFPGVASDSPTGIGLEGGPETPKPPLGTPPIETLDERLKRLAGGAISGLNQF